MTNQGPDYEIVQRNGQQITFISLKGKVKAEKEKRELARFLEMKPKNSERVKRPFSKKEQNEDQITKRKVNWVSVIPKIGGSSIGSFQAASNLPLYQVSYSEFQRNDAHIARYWPTVPMIYLDQIDQNQDIINCGSEIDFVIAVCPCSGLSMLNTAKTGKAGRGGDSAKNDWMIETSVWVLGKLKPKVLIGENAPALFSEEGDKVVTKLRAIGTRFGYSFSLMKTNAERHGLPQKRIRTFYFFWKSPTAPLLNWISKKPLPLSEYLKLIPKNASQQDIFIHSGVASEKYRPYQFVLEREGLTHAQFSKKFLKGTIAKNYLQEHDLFDECIEWLKKYYPNDKASLDTNSGQTHIQKLEHFKAKLKIKKGYWDDSLKFMGESFTAVIRKNIISAVHPVENRFFNLREILHLMGFPHDFEIDNIKNMNHVCQTVPVNTARDWTEEVVKFCNGDLPMSDVDYVRQDNTNGSVEFGEEGLQTKRRKLRKGA